jgi:hypothetical protein
VAPFHQLKIRSNTLPHRLTEKGSHSGSAA